MLAEAYTRIIPVLAMLAVAQAQVTPVEALAMLVKAQILVGTDICFIILHQLRGMSETNVWM